ncbi:hypothetical protein A8C32_11545 [Flavivirga aquatica]|uniref:Biotin carboxyl carrier protein of acetyl-CoA carboxylase n=1 Tax=Flavivirga aquatica TaxID=1849968 RepID=A0A1E5TDD0_9FLAO|nr:biotin/lipoyl-containing protein [Flavivirga aquatica]OEK09347.1 hypothetical protein A8C32_11545 [Flavivirga aquatica]
MNLKEVQSLITSVAKFGASELKLDFDDTKITIKAKRYNTNNIKVLAPNSDVGVSNFKVPMKVEAAKDIKLSEISEEINNLNQVVIRSPFIGTFSLESSVEKSKKLEVGDFVERGDFLCAIEALKLMNQVNSDASGNIKEILVKDKTPVEFGQPLFIISI